MDTSTTNTKINDDSLKCDDLLLYLDKYLTYLLPLKYLNHPFLITNTDGSITKLNCENNNFLEIEDTFNDDEEKEPKTNQTIKSNCFLTIYPTICDIKLDEDDSDSNSSYPNNITSKKNSLNNQNNGQVYTNSDGNSSTFQSLNSEIEKKFNIKNLFCDPKEMIKESKDWINQFINYYIFVLNWVKYEELFKKHSSVNDRILARIMGFAYSILDNIANPDLNPAFQSFYLKDDPQPQDKASAMSLDVDSNNNINNTNVTTTNTTTNITTESSSSSSSLLNTSTIIDNTMESSSSSSSSSTTNTNRNMPYLRPSHKNKSSTSSSTSSHSNNYANTIPVLPSNKTSIIQYYSPKLKNKILLITKLIRILSRYEISSQLIGENRGITILLQIMKLFGDSIDIQIECSASMANLASITSNRVKMLEEGCINLILENMNKFITSSDVQAEICATLANLACHDANAKHIVENGGCEYILRAMITHMDKTDLQIQAFHSLSSLCKYGKEEMEKERFIQVLKTSIIKHQNSVDLMVSACNALGLMALSGMKMTSCKGTILVIILKALKKFEDHQIFQITAFFSLSHLLCIHDSTKDEAYSEIISKYKGVELILTAMKRFPYYISLQTTACFALESIIMNNDNHRKEFLELDGIDIILNVMRFDFSLLKKKKSGSDGERNDIMDSMDENENIDVSITLDIDSSSESLFYSKYKDNSFHSFSKELLLQLFGSVALLNASDNKQCKEMIIKKGCLHYIYLASKKVANCNDLWLVLYYVFARFSNNNENSETKSIYMKPSGVPSLMEICSRKIINKYTQNAYKAYLKNCDSQKTLIDTPSCSSLNNKSRQDSSSVSRSESLSDINNTNLYHHHHHHNNNNNNNQSTINNNTINQNHHEEETHHNNSIYNNSSSSLNTNNVNNDSNANNNEESIQIEIEEININDDPIIEEDNHENEVNQDHNENNHNEENASDMEMDGAHINEEDGDGNEEEDEEDEENDDNHDEIFEDAMDSDQSLKDHIKENPLRLQQKTDEWKQNELNYINSLPISSRVQDYLLSREYCCICGKVCFESGVRLYSINRKKDCSLVYMCSKECAQKDLLFNKRIFYYVNSDTAQQWWYEKQLEAVKSKKEVNQA
ncbi:ARM repeat-containing protein [Neocallimastix lanati (nom. inval.)]|uniref:ARM repeat-containing protein n=1 Tax=Neocallimastix californiae TaxID=1754190 RepID=A0A1Y2FMG7_9FUNG|nr:ARM repeat-containing protein [Neocallimastix sp. JGI-2020a]ORY85173.1 ARM repeat-containing protein [Neocallimastix californiae]|eukprot:ORY85173.1 ARM repeat-containing protein [Neocallimastix californiae]